MILQTHRNTLRQRPHDALEKFKNCSFAKIALIRHENGAFQKCSSNRRNLKTPALRFRVDGEHFENGAFRQGVVTIIT